jgi:phospholipid transport system substrate-binding protein
MLRAHLRPRNLIRSALVTTAVVSCGAIASGRESALAFIRKEHDTMSRLLREPPTAAREAKIDGVLGGLVDYDEFARRSFGQPCPRARPRCVDHWTALTAPQRAEVTPLLQKLVMKTERKNVLKTLDYDIDYKGERASEGDTTVRMEARSRLAPRDPPLQIDYAVAATGDAWHVVDIVTEGSSRTKNYYEQFDRMLLDPSEGYPYVVKKLKEKIEKKDVSTADAK